MADRIRIYAIHLYRSEDGGKTWEDLVALQDLPEEVRKNWRYPQPPHREHVRHIFVHPDDSKLLHVCLEHGGIVRSFDRGKTWEDVSRGIDYLDIHHISSAPGRQDLYFVATALGTPCRPGPLGSRGMIEKGSGGSTAPLRAHRGRRILDKLRRVI